MKLNLIPVGNKTTAAATVIGFSRNKRQRMTECKQTKLNETEQIKCIQLSGSMIANWCLIKQNRLEIQVRYEKYENVWKI